MVFESTEILIAEWKNCRNVRHLNIAAISIPGYKTDFNLVHWYYANEVLELSLASFIVELYAT